MNATMPLLDVDYNLANIELKEKGFFRIDATIDSQYCTNVKIFIDEYAASHQCERNYADSEVRIWHAETLNEAVKDFSSLSDELLTNILGSDMKTDNVLAMRNLAVPTGDDSLAMGRWHLDSYRDQYKVFLFLTDTSAQSGSFEFFPYTHTRSFKRKNIFRYFSLFDLTHKTGLRKYRSLDEKWLERINNGNNPSQAFICKLGTLLVINTSAIHRARPCLSGNRYSLTSYYP